VRVSRDGYLYYLAFNSGTLSRVEYDATTPPRIFSFTASKVLVSPGEAISLQWSVGGADALTLDGSPVGPNGPAVVVPTQGTTYTLTAANAIGTTSAIVNVEVDDGTLAIARPAITAPLNGQVVSVRGVTFSWVPQQEPAATGCSSCDATPVRSCSRVR